MDVNPEVARELVSAYADAADRHDDEARAYACGQIEDFIGDTDDDTPDEVLLPLLDLPLDNITLPLLSSVSAMLRRRGPGVVEPLLVAAVGEGLPEVSLSDVVGVAGAVGALLEAATRSPGASPRVENALSVLDALPYGDLILGLVEVLEGRRDEHVKQVASEMLVDIGDDAVNELTKSLRDGDADYWAADTLAEIKARRDESHGSDEDAADIDDDWTDGEADAGETGADEGDAGQEADAGNEDEDAAGDRPVDEVTDGPPLDESPAAGADAADRQRPRDDDPARSSSTPPPVIGPDPSRLEADYDAFLRRFDEETGRQE